MQPGRLVQKGPGHYTIVFDDKPRRRANAAKMCHCGRALNTNNRSGWCRECIEAPRAHRDKLIDR
jgi:hypothetical protein